MYFACGEIFGYAPNSLTTPPLEIAICYNVHELSTNALSNVRVTDLWTKTQGKSWAGKFVDRSTLQKMEPACSMCWEGGGLAP